MRSTSSILLEYLRKQAVGFTYVAHELTKVLQQENPTVTQGGVGGWSSTAAKKGWLMEKYQHYTVVDLTNATTKNTRSRGGVAGRQTHHTLQPKIVTVESVRDQLLQLACDLESAKTPLSDFSTEALLEELTLRNRSATAR